MFKNSSFGLRFSKSIFSKSNCNLSTITDNKQINYLTALRTKPFMLIAGISGTGKSRIVRKLAQATVTEELQRANGYTGGDFANDRWTLHSPANFELIQVKPNWHNSMDVIGYLSNIPSPHYVFTPFIEFIVKAWQHPEVPFFLCLDDMTDRIAALDNFTLMKILSRIEGDEKKLKITDSEADKERIAKAEVNVDEAKQYGDLNILTALHHIITNQLGEQDKLHSVKKIDKWLL